MQALMGLSLQHCSGEQGGSVRGEQHPPPLAGSFPIHTSVPCQGTLHIWVVASRAKDAISGDRLQLV